MLKEEVNKEFLDFEQEVMKILNEPVNKQFLIKASTEEIKNNMSTLLKYLKNTKKITENLCGYISGKEVSLELLEDKEDKCFENLSNMASYSAKSLTNQIKMITNKRLSDHIFNELNVD